VRKPASSEAELFQARMQRAVAELLERDRTAVEALANGAKLRAVDKPSELAVALFALDCVAMFAACIRAHASLRKLRTPAGNVAAEVVQQVALTALPALYRIGAVQPRRVGECALLAVEAPDLTATELVMARVDERRARFRTDETGLATGLPKLPDMHRIELGKQDVASEVEQRIGFMRKHLSMALVIPSQGLSEVQVDQEINRVLEWHATGATNLEEDRFRHYYLFVNDAGAAFAQRLAVVYPTLHVVQLQRSLPPGTDVNIHTEISRGLMPFLSGVPELR
jgi:hypothetical protein